MSEADDRYVAEIARDCERILGAGVELVDVTRDDGATGVRLAAHYRIADHLLESTADGETVVAAHAALRERLVVDRVRYTFTELLDRP
jgi:hypothetical protein